MQKIWSEFVPGESGTSNCQFVVPRAKFQVFVGTAP